MKNNYSYLHKKLAIISFIKDNSFTFSRLPPIRESVMKKFNLFKYLLPFFILIVMSGCDTTRANYPISFSESYEQFLKNRPANFKMPIPNLDIEVTVAPTKDPLKIKDKIGTYFWYNETYDFISKKKKISLEIDQIILKPQLAR